MNKDDIKILIDMEELSHKLINKYIIKEYNEEGEVINEEWETWTKYWNVVQKILESEKN